MKLLISKLQRKNGKNNRGIITSRHRGGGHKRLYREIDFKRQKLGVYARVKAINYDPNRNSKIALLYYTDGKKSYILAPNGLKIGQLIVSDFKVPILPGNSLPIRNIPLGIDIHNIELTEGRGAQLVRSAGASAQIIGKQRNSAVIQLPSKEIRLVSTNCWATIGQIGNINYNNIKIGKAGRNRWKGCRPTVRGVAMNAADHPHGGGEGKAPIGRVQPVTPWGKPALGKRTRKSKKYSNKFILSRRK